MNHKVLLGVCAFGLTARLVAQGGPGSASPTNPGAYVTTQRFEDYTRAHEREHELIAQAIVEARRTVDLRLEGMNDLRQQITTERAAYATAAGAETLRQRIDKLEQAQAAQAGSNATWTIVLGVFFTVLQLGMRFLPVRKR